MIQNKKSAVSWMRKLCIVLSAAVFLSIFERAGIFYTMAAEYGSSYHTGAESDTGLALYGMLPVYGNEIHDGEYSIRVKSSSDALVFEDVKLSVTDGEMAVRFSVENKEAVQLKIGNADCPRMSEKDEKPVYSAEIEALDQELECAVYDASGKEWSEYRVLFEASSLPKEALLVELPDYDLIEKAVRAYENSGEKEEETIELLPVTPVSVDLKDGEYAVSLDMEGGSGKAYITSPTLLVVKDGKAYARVEWSSSNYDYMIVGTEKYLNLSDENANSVFEIPIGCWDEAMTVIADTTAMGTPHEVEYTLIFYKDSIGSKGQLPQEAAKRVVVFALIIIVGGGIFNYFLKKKRAAV